MVKSKPSPKTKKRSEKKQTNNTCFFDVPLGTMLNELLSQQKKKKEIFN